MNDRNDGRPERNGSVSYAPEASIDESKVLDSRPWGERRQQDRHQTKILALLVGINDYPAPTTKLRGCIQDVDNIAAYLRESYGTSQTTLNRPTGRQGPLQIVEDGNLCLCVLKDEQATYSNIVRGFRDHLCQATSDDTVWFHFSGHGTETPTAEAFEASIEPNGKDQAFVCYQAPGSSDRLHLADKEIAILLDEVASSERAKSGPPHIVVSIDACHSGSGTRDVLDHPELLIRNYQPPRSLNGQASARRTLGSYLDGFYGKQKSLEIPVVEYVFLSACKPVEKAGDMPEGGVFTTSLVNTLKTARDAKKNLHYAQLFTQTRAAAHRLRNEQTPQFETIGGFDPYTCFLEGWPLGTPDRYEVFRNGRIWYLRCGAIHGLPMRSKEKIKVKILHAVSGRLASFAFVEKIGAQHSRLILPEDSQGVRYEYIPALKRSRVIKPATALDDNVPYVAEILSLPADPVYVRLSGQEALTAALRAAWDRSKNILLIDDDPHQSEVPAIDITANDRGDFTLTEVASGRKFSDIAAESGDGDIGTRINFVKADLNKIVRWMRTIELDNPASKIRNKFDFELQVKDKNELERTYRDKEIKLYGSSENLSRDKFLWFNFKVTLKDDSQDLYFYAFDLNTNCRIRFRNDEEKVARSADMKAGTPMLLRAEPYGWGLGDGDTEVTRWFKLFVTTEELDYHQLTQLGLQGSRGEVETDTYQPDLISDDWCAVTIKVKLVRQYPQDGTAGGRIGSSDANITLKGAGGAKIALIAAEAGSPSGDPANQLAKFERQGLQLIDLGSGRPGIPRQNVLELTDLPVSLSQDPLEIVLPNILSNDDMLLPIAFDGLNFRVIGDAAVQGREMIVRIRELPKLEEPSTDSLAGAETEARSHSAALKLALFKMTLKQASQNQLSRVTVKADGAIERRTEAEPLKRNAEARRILLVLHGLVGDTEDVIQSLRYSRNRDSIPILNQYDLVLAFDYDSLNTPIETTAQQLKNDLEKAGIQAGDGKTVTLLAHSIGGLVGRYWIEHLDGRHLVDHLILLGTPNQGSLIDGIEKAQAFSTAALDIAINFMPNLIPFAGTLVHAVSGATELLPTFEQMRPGSEFLVALNGGPDPNIPYAVVVGDRMHEEGEAKGLRDLLTDIERRLGLEHTPDKHDMAATFTSVLNEAAWRAWTPRPEPIPVGCHHWSYAMSKSGRDALGSILHVDQGVTAGPGQGTDPKITRPRLSTPVNNRSELTGFPKSYAIVIGINHYPHINASLTSAVPDAEQLYEVLRYRQGFDHVKVLIDATKAEIMDWFARIRNGDRAPQIKAEDSLVFYFAGHGKAGEFNDGPVGYLLPSDARPQSAALENKSLIPMGDVFEAIEQLGCHHTLLIFDCCFAGRFRYVGQRNRDVETLFFTPMYRERFERYKRKKAWQVLVSAGPEQTAADWMGERSSSGEGPHSPFAQALFKALEGDADVKPKGKNLGDGVLTIQELFLYLRDEVETQTKNNSEFKTQYPDLFPMANHDGGQFIFFDPNNVINYPERNERNPYKGLSPYGEQDVDLFHGRETAVNALYEKITQSDTPLLVVSAPSGFGKSSVVLAGLWPRLKEKDEFEPYFEQSLAMRPGRQPHATWRALSPRSLGKPQLLVIDQYEELFTACEDKAEREAFEAELVETFNKAKAGQLKIILTIRSDFEWQLKSSVFGKAVWPSNQLPDFLYRLAPMNLDELRAAIVNPALVEAYDFESDDLVDAILQDINHAPGALPLLSFTMSELYKLYQKHRDRDHDERTFTSSMYDALDGVEGALSMQADTVYDRLPDEAHRWTMRNMMLRMVRPSDGSYTRRRVSYDDGHQPEPDNGLSHELDYPDEDHDRRVATIIEALRKAQLMVQGQEKEQSYVEPAHDALINYWSTCRGWIKGFGQDNLILQRQLWQAVSEYHNNGRKDQYLWDTNPKLQQVLVSVLDPGDRWIRQQLEGNEDMSTLAFLLWEKEPSETQLQKLVPWQQVILDHVDSPQNVSLQDVSPQALHAWVMAKADLWLNQSELQFVKASFERLYRQIEALRQQRDEALRRNTLLLVEQATQANDRNSYVNGARKALEALPSSMAKPDKPYVAEAEVQLSRSMQNLPDCKVLEGHQDRVTFGAFSRDGTYVITASHDRTARIWDAQTGHHVSTLSGHEKRVTHAAFHPEGKQAATASEDGTVRLWDITSGTGTILLESDFSPCFHLDFSSDGMYIAAIFYDFYFSDLKVCHIPTGDIIMNLTLDYLGNAIFSPKPKDWLIVVTSRGGRRATTDLNILDRRTGEVWAVAEGHTAGHYYATFDRRGDYIVSASADRTARLWKVEKVGTDDVPSEPWSQEVIKAGPILVHADKVFHADFSPDSKYVVTASKDTNANIWSAETGELISALAEHTEDVRHAAFSSVPADPADPADPKSWLVVTASRDDTAKVWDTKSGTSRFTLGGHTGDVTHAVFSPDGKHVLTTGDTTARLYALTDNPSIILTPPENWAPIRSVAFSPDGKLVETYAVQEGAHGLSIIRLWNVDDGKPAGSRFGAPFDSDVQPLFQKEIPQEVELEVPDKKIFKEHKNIVNYTQFSPDGRFLATASVYDIENEERWNLEDHRICLWDAKTYELHKILSGHTAPLNNITFSHDGKRLASASQDHTARLWDVDLGETIGIFQHQFYVSDVAFSPNDRKLVTVSGDIMNQREDVGPRSWDRPLGLDEPPAKG